MPVTGVTVVGTRTTGSIAAPRLVGAEGREWSRGITGEIDADTRRSTDDPITTDRQIVSNKKLPSFEKKGS